MERAFEGLEAVPISDAMFHLSNTSTTRRAYVRRQEVESMLNLLVVLSAALPPRTGQTEAPRVRKVTPVLVVDRIEPSLELWVQRLGFEKTIEVPEGDHLGFVAVARDGIELMYQTRDSVMSEIANEGLPKAFRPSPESRTTLFCEVDDLEAIRSKLEGLDILLSYRKTTYGAEELWMREPGGHIIGFAELPSSP